MTAPTPEEVVRGKLSALKIQIDKLEADVKAYDPLKITLQELTLYTKKVYRQDELLQNLRNELYGIVTDDKLIAKYETTLEPFDKNIRSTRLMIHALQVPITPATPTPAANLVKLEQLKIPTFSGKFEEWPAFRD